MYLVLTLDVTGDYHPTCDIRGRFDSANEAYQAAFLTVINYLRLVYPNIRGADVVLCNFLRRSDKDIISFYDEDQDWKSLFEETVLLQRDIFKDLPVTHPSFEVREV